MREKGIERDNSQLMYDIDCVLSLHSQQQSFLSTLQRHIDTAMKFRMMKMNRANNDHNGRFFQLVINQIHMQTNK